MCPIWVAQIALNGVRIYIPYQIEHGQRGARTILPERKRQPTKNWNQLSRPSGAPGKTFLLHAGWYWCCFGLLFGTISKKILVMFLENFGHVFQKNRSDIPPQESPIFFETALCTSSPGGPNLYEFPTKILCGFANSV